VAALTGVVGGELFDAALTERGVDQARAVKSKLEGFGGASKVDLLLVSPLQRTCQTLSFAFQAQLDAGMVPVAVELCRERYGGHLGDKRSSITVQRSRFPTFDFGLIEDDADVLWTAQREDLSSVVGRAHKFMCWLRGRAAEGKHQVIAVVTHSYFLSALLNGGVMQYSEQCEADIMGQYVPPANVRSIAVRFTAS
jgi:broad specificity phosphatase PhoE